MAGTQKAGPPTYPPPVSPTTSRTVPTPQFMDANFDLLTGIPPGGDPFQLEPPSSLNLDSQGAVKSSFPTQSCVASVTDPSFHYPMYNSIQARQPLDLLTGLVSSSVSHSPLVSPTSATTNRWNAENLENPPVGSTSAPGLCRSYGMAANNPFLDSGVITNAYGPPRQVPSRLPGAVKTSNSSSSGSLDHTFAQFNSIPGSPANSDLRILSTSGRTATPGVSAVSGTLSLGSRNSPTSSTLITKCSNSSNFSDTIDSFLKTDILGRNFSIPSAIDLDRLEMGASTVDSPRLIFDPSDSSPIPAPPSKGPSPSETLWRSPSQSKSDQWGPSTSGSSRIVCKENVAMQTRRSLSSANARAASEEFVGASGKGIYRAPLRGAVHPARPVSLELRPHPLRGALPNQVTRLTCLKASVWAACELGLMIWDVQNAIGKGSSGTRNNLGDEDAAVYEFLRLQGSSTLSMVADVANKVVWTGHRDGKMRLWPGHSAHTPTESRSASLTFQAHRPAVTALVVTPYGVLGTTWAVVLP